MRFFQRKHSLGFLSEIKVLRGKNDVDALCLLFKRKTNQVFVWHKVMLKMAFLESKNAEFSLFCSN